MIRIFTLNRNVLLIYAVLFFHLTVFSQNTVGTIFYNDSTQDGFTLITLHKQTFLIDNCGQVVNQWTSEFTPGSAVYLLENGDILRAGNTESSNFQFGGNGGVIERYNWDGDLIWQYFYDNEEHRQHHDIYPMSNGNILILAATLITEQQAIQAGRDPAKLAENKLYNERIIEVEPSGFGEGNIVWEWNFFDHIIQDLDPTKDNFGDVSLNPQKVDINFTQTEFGGARWLHINSMQLNEELDQIVLSSRHLNELYIIDHSTTTEEAASSAGGMYGKGGDFLYRWGNPQVYRQGTESDRKLGGQHFPHFIGPGLRDEGKLIVYNNDYKIAPNRSAVFVLNLPQTSEGNYTYVPNTKYGPNAADYIYTQDDLYSPIVSSAQRLPNGNTLICEGSYGEIREITEDERIVWKYIVPIDYEDGTIISQGEDPRSLINLTFRAIKYSPDYPAFDGRDLTPGDPIELNPNISSCITLSGEEQILQDVSLYPNPTTGIINIHGIDGLIEITIFNLNGQILQKVHNSSRIDISNYTNGLYFMKLNIGKKSIVTKIIKH